MTAVPRDDGYPEPPGRWAEHAACRGDSASMMLPERAGAWSAARWARVDLVKARCYACPVYSECRTWALGRLDPAAGMIAAGMTPGERQHARRAR